MVPWDSGAAGSLCSLFPLWSLRAEGIMVNIEALLAPPHWPPVIIPTPVLRYGFHYSWVTEKLSHKVRPLPERKGAGGVIYQCNSRRIKKGQIRQRRPAQTDPRVAGSLGGVLFWLELSELFNVECYEAMVLNSAPFLGSAAKLKCREIKHQLKHQSNYTGEEGG